MAAWAEPGGDHVGMDGADEGEGWPWAAELLQLGSIEVCDFANIRLYELRI